MRFGVCCGIDQVPIVAEKGYDFVELGLAGTLRPEADNDDFEPMRRRVLDAPLPCEAFNCFLPGDLKITGPLADMPRLETYVATAMRRAGEVGGKIVAVGSGGARGVPDGFPHDRARWQLQRAFEIIGEEAARNGITVAIEPLCRKECNVINTVAEALELAREVDLPAVRVLADFYHVDEEDEPFTNLRDAGDLIVHIHTADTGRKHPGSGSYDYPGFFGVLKAVGYDARVSIECGWDDFPAQAGPALEFLKEQWEAAGG